MKNFFNKIKRITAYTWALIVLVAIYFVTGITTLGSTQNTGESFYLEANKTAYFNVLRPNGERLDDIYANIGLIYGKEGEAANVTVKYYSSTNSATPTANSSYWKELGKVKIANAYNENAKDGSVGSNFNWIPIITDTNKSYSYISITSDTSMEINELVCLNQSGEKLFIKECIPDGTSRSTGR